jgi:hypothetical protein
MISPAHDEPECPAMIVPDEEAGAPALLPETRLACAVVARVVQDLHSASPHLRHEARAAIERGSLRLWVDAVGVPYDVVVARLLALADQPEAPRRAVHRGWACTRVGHQG